MRRLYPYAIIVCILGLGLGIWFGRTQLLARYYVRQLSAANPENRDPWIARALSLDEAVVPALIACLDRNDDQACDNAMTALKNLLDRWASDDPRAISLSCRIGDAFPAMSAAGQEKVLRLMEGWQKDLKESGRRALLYANTGRLLIEAAHVQDPAVRQQAMTLALKSLTAQSADKVPPHAGFAAACGDLARGSLADATDGNRILAIQLAQRPEINLLTEIVPLLRDRSAAVRRAAILALGPAPEVIGDDHLFYWLTDPDADVRQLCEMALRGRGLQESHIRLARLMADRRPAVRLEVIDNLQADEDLDAGAWLRRLSHDPVPAIRAAAARAAVNQARSDLRDRIEQMAQTDPSPTVQQVARYYLSCQSLGEKKSLTP
jgi:HEAT repeat protein